MDSILELDPAEIRFIRETTQINKEVFLQYAPALFDDAFNILLTTGAKTDNFHLIKEINSGSDASGALSDLLNAVLSVCQAIFKNNPKGTEEF